MTTGVFNVDERSALMGYLFHCAEGEDDLAFAAKRLTIAIHREEIADEIVARLARQSPGHIMHLLALMKDEDVRLSAVPGFVSRALSGRPGIQSVLRSRRNLDWNSSAA